MTMQLGDLEVDAVSGGRLWIDGGNIFGVVPKVLWQKQSAPDDRNRIELETNCLLVRTETATVLIDTGYGSKATDRQRDNHAMEDGKPLVENLSRIGIEPADVDMVILTHLHFDHAGGSTFIDGSGTPRPTFPRARYVVQRREWEDATADLPELSGAYFNRDFVPFDQDGQLELIDGEVDLMPGISTRLTGGHTRGHQIILLGSGDQRAVCPADLCPTTAHLPTFWTTSYDQFLLTLRRIKPDVLGEAADNNWLVLFGHDPLVKAAYLNRDDKRQFVVREQVTL